MNLKLIQQAISKAEALTSCGNTGEAITLYKKVLQLSPKNEIATQAIANLKRLESNNRSTLSPLTIKRLASLYQRGHFQELIDQANLLTKKFPQSYFLWNFLGAANMSLKRIGFAESNFRKVCDLNPKYPDGYNSLGIALKNQNKFVEAIEAYDKAISIKPNYAEAHYNKALALSHVGRKNDAINSYQTAISFKSDYVEAFINLADVLKDAGEFKSAIDAYKKALLLRPNQAEIAYNLGNAFQKIGQFDASHEAYKKALSIKPDYVDALINLGGLLKNRDLIDEALLAYKQALEIDPCLAEIHNNMGVIFQTQGKVEIAKKAYLKAIKLKPEYAEAHRNLSALKKFSKNDPQIKQIEKLLKQQEGNEQDRHNLFFALAKAKEDLGDLENAFKLFKEGNYLKKRKLGYDIEEDKKRFLAIKKSFEYIQQSAIFSHKPDTLPVPIFIVGMPRSGTTLVEQIISSHSKVQGAGELYYVNQHGLEINIGKVQATKSSLMTFQNEYVSEVSKLSKGHKYITDKMPHNFSYIGLICSAIPQAKIIHVKRRPEATCWSNFKHCFASDGLGYSYDLNDVVEHYKLYQDLMDFWNQSLSHRIYNLDYDRLTNEQEIETKKLINHLGIGWEESCLSPQKNKRSVQTASQAQVRKGIYKGSSNDWKSYEKFIGRAFESLSR